MPILWFNLAGLVGAAAQGLTGFGTGTLMVSLLVMAYPFREVVPVVALVVFAPNALMTWLIRREIEWRRGPVAALGLSIGLVIGAQMLAVLPADILRRGLGVAILLYVVLMLARTPVPDEWPPATRTDLSVLGIASIFSGVIVGAVGVTPLPLLIYTTTRYPKQLARSVLTQGFLAGAFVQNGIYIYLGLLDARLAWTALASLPGVLLGLVIGHYFHYRVNQKTFGRALALVLLLPAARLVVG